MVRKSRDEQARQTAPDHVIPIYQAAIDNQEASFPLLLKLRRDLKKAEKEEQKDARCQSLGWYYARAYQAFGQAYGKITELHLADDGSALALTDKNQFFSNYCITNDADVDRLLLQCDQMATEANRLLRGKDLQACTQILYAAAKTLLCIKQIGKPDEGKEKQEDGEREGCLKVVKNHLAYAREYHQRAARLSAERYYSGGMLMGILFVVVALLALGTMPLPDEIQGAHVLASLVGGGVGALVSVMWRMTTGKLTVRHEVERWTLMLVGSFRPLIGAIFGLLVYALIQSGLLPLTVTPAGSLHFYGVIGFLAGFSERWAPDLLQTTENGLRSPAGIPSPETSLETVPGSSRPVDGRIRLNGTDAAATEWVNNAGRLR